MKRLLTLTILVLFASNCYASSFNTFETKQEAYDRRSNENYQQYRNNNYQQPLGGYNRPINDDGGRYYGSTNNNFGSALERQNKRESQNNYNPWNN